MEMYNITQMQSEERMQWSSVLCYEWSFCTVQFGIYNLSRQKKYMCRMTLLLVMSRYYSTTKKSRRVRERERDRERVNKKRERESWRVKPSLCPKEIDFITLWPLEFVAYALVTYSFTESTGTSAALPHTLRTACGVTQGATTSWSQFPKCHKVMTQNDTKILLCFLSSELATSSSSKPGSQC